ncbi:C-3',4' desaturase CrtD [Persicobacter diffluens]|uniref:C-3',4' desaturase CrtD n=2 Tax=Persicobacter diffluens TaxID=981 RepID=A0AAN4VVH9_9BACT|nr:C-3',4' desaturase CrtD [Persicobacter diffluens]
MTQTMNTKFSDVLVVGSGMGSLTAACLLAQKGLKVTILEQNWIPGGCTTSYWRKGFVFEAGATTLVGLDEGMPLKVFLDTIGLRINARKLELPMRVKLKKGGWVSRYEDIEKWIQEAERVFGASGQRGFWERCYALSQFVWQQSSRQLTFPPEKWQDLSRIVRQMDYSKIGFGRFVFSTVQDLLVEFGLASNQAFCEFVDEQLMITAQNTREQVNALFGAAALCYTNYSNFYLDGGMKSLVDPLVAYLKSKGGDLLLRKEVRKIRSISDGYEVLTSKEKFHSRFIVGGIPVNNLADISEGLLSEKLSSRLFSPEALNSAFQMGIGFKTDQKFKALHFQIHLKEKLSGLSAQSIFVSLSHEQDALRSDTSGCRVASVSTHLAKPHHNFTLEKTQIEEEIVALLEKEGIFSKENIIYQHSATQKAWQKWTCRKWGFVGGYPQLKSVKPWAMNAARWDKKGAYLVGDTVYPGQGIPGVTLSGMIAAEKLWNDWKGEVEIDGIKLGVSDVFR